MKKFFYISFLLFTMLSCGDDQLVTGPENELYPHKYVFDRIEYTRDKVDFVLQSDGFHRVGDWNYETTSDTSFIYEDEYEPDLTSYSFDFIDEFKVDVLFDDIVVIDTTTVRYLSEEKFVHILDEDVPTDIDTLFTLRYNDDKSELSIKDIIFSYIKTIDVDPTGDNGVGGSIQVLTENIETLLDQEIVNEIGIGDTVNVWTFESVMKRMD